MGKLSCQPAGAGNVIRMPVILVPDVLSAPQSVQHGERFGRKRVHAIDVEGRDDVFFEVFVLVIAEDDYGVGGEVVYGLSDLLERLPVSLLML